MRHHLITASLLVLSSAVLSPSAKAAVGDKHIRINAENLAKLPLEDQQRVLEIQARLEQITEIDRSALDRSDRKAIRTEVKALTNEAKSFNSRAGGSVVYISTAGLIIIILLLIIIL